MVASGGKSLALSWWLSCVDGSSVSGPCGCCLVQEGAVATQQHKPRWVTKLCLDCSCLCTLHYTGSSGLAKIRDGFQGRIPRTNSEDGFCRRISRTNFDWSAANGGLRDGGLSKTEDIWGKRPFSSVFWISQVLFAPSGKGRKRQKKGEKGRFRPISRKAGQTPLKPPFVTPPFAAAQFEDDFCDNFWRRSQGRRAQLERKPRFVAFPRPTAPPPPTHWN